jgi:hypothetical protein
VPYRLIVYLHVFSAFSFIAIHGVSMAVLYAVRNDVDRKRVAALMRFSAWSVAPMYVSLAMVVGTGLWMGFEVTGWFSKAWYWLALTLLIVITAFMWFVARPFGERILAACAIRPSGVPRRSDEELSQILRSRRTHVITAVGGIGLAVILFLMVFRPNL